MTYYNSNRNKENQKIKEYILKWCKKIKAIQILGGKCSVCGETHPAKLTFHHKDPKEKEFNIAKRQYGEWISSKYEEINKCILLCFNCHNNIHNPDITNPKFLSLEIHNSFECKHCGYNKNLSILEFHHIDNNEKEFSVSNYIFNKRWKTTSDVTEKLIDEIKKCIVLCPNCHMIEHTVSLNVYEKYKKYIIDKSQKYVYHRPRKININDVIKLNNEGKNQTEIAKILNCKPNTICIILKQHKIPHKNTQIVDLQEIEKYMKEGKTVEEISKITGFRSKTIRKHINKKLN